MDIDQSQDEINFTNLRNNKTINKYEHLSQNEDEINANLLPRREEELGIISRWVFRPLMYVSSIFCKRRTHQVVRGDNFNFSDLPAKVNNLNSFNILTKTKLGIILLYQQSDLEFISNFIRQIKNEEYILDILVKYYLPFILKIENYVFYPAMTSSREGKQIISAISDPIMFPAFIFTSNKNERERGRNNFNKRCFIDKLEGTIEKEIFRDALIRNIENKENFDEPKEDSNVTLIKQQNEEMEYLERIENEKKIREMEEKSKIEKEKELKRKKEEELEKIKKEKLNSLPAEPSCDNPSSTYIIFRYPDGSRRQERRFLKTDKIQVILLFILDSL